jgi:hypothetical protein
MKTIRIQSNQLKDERMDDGMKNLTTIKTSADVNKITVSKIQNMELQKPGVVVTMDDGQAYLFPIMTTFQIHRCNEFLRSLNLGMEIGFYYDGSMDSINQYAFLVKNCMNTLRIKRIMDSLELPDGVTPDEVNFIVLGRLSNKNKMNLNIALVNNLEAKVHEAVKIIRKERLVQA